VDAGSLRGAMRRPPQCEKNNYLMEDHIPLLINHGMWHCLGYDHETDEDYEVMKKK
jgi:ssRNA-specific RNase YbeY (16S rRNA maturation enzyme)